MLKLTKESSIAEKYGHAMKVETQEDADAYFEECVRHSTGLYGLSRESMETHVRKSIGYYAGYYSHETRRRVERLFNCEHPMLGKAGDEPPTPQECFDAGSAYMEKIREEGRRRASGKTNSGD